ncbi:uncharacterized protein LOC101238552 isoform X2 [Hydra vulgaris]|uniref:uncharacterized protein LOC101238552 isoform X2 n=1 Tax=Hydra vulgaris TaxID=6087 RepID=UPI001F5F2E0E|nr:uncharacterized protein LOC101238552 isoform X2 [Hydra vulgaris]
MNIIGDFTDSEQQIEIILPIELFGESLLGLPAGSRVFQISAFGNFYNISVQPQIYFEGVPVQYLSSNNILEQTILVNQTCFYSGPSDGSLLIVLSYCDGLEGFIKAPSDEFFIQPIKTDVPINILMPRRHIVYRAKDININISDSELLFEETSHASHIKTNWRKVSRFRRNGYESFLDFINRSGRRVQLLYFDSYGKELPFMTILVNEKRGVNTFHGTKWLVKDEKTGQVLLIDGKKSYTARQGSRRVSLVITTPTGMTFEDVLEKDGGKIPDYFAEVIVVADQSLTKFHGKNALEKYILTMFNIADIVFKDKSFGIRLNMHLVKIVIIEDQQSSFVIHTKNPSRSLTSACKFVSTLDSPGGNYFKDFDFAIVLTREDFGPSGYARLHSMCVKGSSCALVKDEGLTSAFIIAHEVGHLLSLDHDGEGESAKCGGETARGSLMAPIIVARYDRFHWSTCSSEVLKENIEYFQCLMEKPEQPQVFKFHDGLPGKMYTLDDQCQFNFNRQYSLCRSFKFDPCQMLWCSEPDKPSYCKTMRSPALDGSICNEGKHCLKGQCVNDANSSIYTTVQPVVNGNWASWESWSVCSRSCGVGIRIRARDCSNPRPGPKGTPCNGGSFEYEPCNTETCFVTKSFNALRRELCEAITEKSGWTLYADAPFQKRLQFQKENLNCSFESGFCNWVNYNRSKLVWQSHKGTTPSFGTGPDFDHTTKNEKGTYLYMEASSARNESKNEGDTARLVGPVVKIPRLCFTMHYNMFGKDMGQLKIGIMYQNSSDVVLWNKTGNIGKEWQRAEVSIESVDNYRIFIEAVRGIHWSSDIAVDDLAGNSGLCQAEEKARNPCTQSCRSRDGRSFKMNINVADGLTCTDGRNHDICFNGRCLPFGCDNKFNSTLKIDDCGVCNGSSSSCVKVKGVKEVLPKDDYEILQMLPKGVTFVNIVVNYSRVYYFGLKKPDSIGASLSTNYEDFIVMGGTTFQFLKENGLQKIFSSGPTLEVLLLVVYTAAQQSEDKIKLNYEFFQPNDAQSYEYILVGWTACSKTCGIGQQQSIQTCRSSSGRIVNVSYCEFLKKQTYVKTCYRDPCPDRYQWLTHEWSICSKTCGEGFRTRNVSCIKNDRNAYYPNDMCILPPPFNLEKCNLRTCPSVFSWVADQWSSCTVTCGGGVKTRNVSCTDEVTNLTHSAEKCVQPQLETVEPCNEFDCDAFIWEVRLEGQCSKACGRGLKARIVYCVNIRSKNIVPNGYCSGPSPPRVVPCNEHMCPEYFWQVHNNSLCSVTCGLGVIQKEVYCVDKQTKKKVINENCIAKKPNDVEECYTRPCDKYQWFTHEWSVCSKTCGEGFRTRNVSCIKNDHIAYYPNGLCVLPPPLSLEKCNLRACPSVFSWVADQWSSCTVTCGGGVKTRNVSCTDEVTNLTHSAEKCVQQLQPETVKPCNEFECDSFVWELKVEGQCTKTCGGGLKARIVYCVNIRSKIIVSNSYCSGPSPPVVVACNEHMCPEYLWQVHNISLCSVSCGLGVIQKEVHCVDKQTNKKVTNEHCKAKKPNDVEECNTRPCDNFVIKYGDWQACSAICGLGYQKRLYSCTNNNIEVHLDFCNINNVTVERSCQVSVCGAPEHLHCDFDEQNFCNWFNEQSDQFDWIISNKTPFSNASLLGYQADEKHSGLFAFIEFSNMRHSTDKAVLVSPAIQQNGGCFVLWYYMTGPNVGYLKVYVTFQYDRKLVFLKEGQQGNEWKRGEVSIEPSHDPIKFIIEASVGEIAVDDIFFYTEKCQDISFPSPKVEESCKDASPYCTHPEKRIYCLDSSVYRTLCCKACAEFL